MKAKRISRRKFNTMLGSSLAATVLRSKAAFGNSAQRPNIVYVFADQWRAQATGYAGDPNAHTPHIDELARQSCNFINAVSGCPVCSPHRASLMTGQYPLTHGVFLNDVHLKDDAVSIAKVLNRAGYQTAYIGKWHLNGRGRSNFIPKENRQGFQFWKAMECTHDYNHSYYYGDQNVKRLWPGYDAIAQTKEAQDYIHDHAGKEPFALFLSWGPPHAPYQTAPEKYKTLAPKDIQLRPNVPESVHQKARNDLAGYYAHIAALDECVGNLLATLKKEKIEKNTIFVFTSDHGDMLYSQGMTKKQKPFEESACVPFLLRYPAIHGDKGKLIDVPLNTPDIMPTLLGLCGVDIPPTVEGMDLSEAIQGTKMIDREGVLLTCPSPFGQWTRKMGGRECRGIRTRRYTYVRDLNGPWLLFDNQKDPYQMENLCFVSRYSSLRKNLDDQLMALLQETHDKFLPGYQYIKQWGYKVDETGTVPYTK